MQRMKFEKNKKYFTVAVYAFLVLTALLIVCFFLMNLSTVWAWLSKLLNIMSPFMYGFVIANLCNPILTFFSDRFYR